MNDNLSVILGVELLCAAQGVEFRAPLQTSAALQSVIQSLRTQVPSLQEDRFMAGDIDAAAGLVRDRQISRAAGVDFKAGLSA
jgi:histidine ammonia-lyase